MLFSVLIANYNNSQYIRQAIDSVIAQTYTDWEAIILDDCSSDGALTIVGQYAAKDARIKFFQNKRNRGVGYTKNRLIDLTRGEILGFLDSDDVLDNKAIELMVKAHKDNLEYALIYSTHYICDENLRILKMSSDVGSLYANETYLTCKEKIHCVSAFATFKKSFYLKNEPLDIRFKKAIDQDLYLKLEETGKVMYIPIPLYYYRHNYNSISLNKGGWSAMLWEVRAKEKAYYRRFGTSIPNITKDKLYGEYYFVYKNLASESLKDKEYGKYLIWCWQFLLKFKNPLKTLKFMYYTLKKYLYPSSFAKDNHGY